MRQKVFGIGLSKTGTTSLYVALHALGYRAGTYGHLNNLGLDNWFYNDFRHDYLKEFDALTDLPIGCFFKELDERYPGSMFILTIRDKKQWLNSCRSFFTNRQNSDSFYCKTQKYTYGAVSFNEILYSRAYDSHMESCLYIF